MFVLLELKRGGRETAERCTTLTAMVHSPRQVASSVALAAYEEQARTATGSSSSFPDTIAAHLHGLALLGTGDDFDVEVGRSGMTFAGNRAVSRETCPGFCHLQTTQDTNRRNARLHQLACVADRLRTTVHRLEETCDRASFCSAAARGDLTAHACTW